MKNYYHIMGLPMTATESEIRQAFRNFAKRFSPEANRGNPMAAARFAEINEAYSVLSNVVLRSQYDKSVLLNPDISVPLTDVAYSAETADIPAPRSGRPRSTVQKTTDKVENRVITVVSQPVTTAGSQSTAKTVTVSQTAAKTVTVSQTAAKASESKPPQKTETAEKEDKKEKPKDEGKAIVQSISERAASMREAFEKAAAQLAAKREAERKARENRHADEAEKKKQAAAVAEEQQKKAQAERERREAAARELAARREREKKERAEREALEKARKEAARLQQTQSAQKRDDVKSRMQSLMSQLGERQSAREQAVAKVEKAAREKEAAQEAAKPVPVVAKEVKAWVSPKEAVPAERGQTMPVAVFETFRNQTEQQIAELKQLVESQNKKLEEQASVIRTLAEQMRGGRGGNYAALSEKVDQMAVNLLTKIRETEAGAEAAAATAALKVAQAQQLQEEVNVATERLDNALRDLNELKRDHENLRSEMEIESAARQRAESAVAGAKQAARTYKEESERATRRAAEERNARKSAERMFTAEAKARKRAEEQSKSDREAVMHMSREITLLRMAKEKAEARAETTRNQIAKAAAEAEREKLAQLEAQQRKHIAEITEKLQNAESEKRELETQIGHLQTRLSEQKELDRKIADQMTEFEQFTNSMSQADEQRLVADWEAKVRADIMLFKDTLYGTLGVPYYATADQIAESAQKLLDRYAVREGDDRYDRIAAVEEARATLLDTDKRAAYNRKIGLKSDEITAALKARSCYEEIVRKLERKKAGRTFWDGFDALAYDAQTGDPAAQNKLGEAYYDGVLMPPDAQQAVFWFKEAAKQLYPAALFNMGMCLLNGYGVERDEVRGRGFIKKAAMVGFGPAAELVESPEFKRALRDAYEG